MKLTEDIKQAIQAEYSQWESQQYNGNSKEKRKKFAQFFTPPQLTVKMLEKFDTLELKDVLDPCLGAGNLIAGAIFAGADPKRCFGIELDPDVLKVAKRRLAILGVPPCNLVEGNALDSTIYEKFETQGM